MGSRRRHLGTTRLLALLSALATTQRRCHVLVMKGGSYMRGEQDVSWAKGSIVSQARLTAGPPPSHPSLPPP